VSDPLGLPQVDVSEPHTELGPAPEELLDLLGHDIANDNPYVRKEI